MSAPKPDNVPGKTSEDGLRALEVWALARTDNGQKVAMVVKELREARELLKEGESLIHDLVVDGWHPGLKDRIDAFLNGGNNE